MNEKQQQKESSSPSADPAQVFAEEIYSESLLPLTRRKKQLLGIIYQCLTKHR
jgi:hypothetical protein